MEKKLLLVTSIFLLILGPFVLAEDTVIINSKDWKDVYSGMQYGYFIGKQPKFLTSDAHSTIILSEVEPGSHIEALSSRKSPFVVGYESIIKSRGFDAKETVFSSLSLELAGKLSDVQNFIIIDDSYGYNAIAVAPYAVVSKSYVLFSDRGNIGDVIDFLNGRTVDSLIIYGQVDREVIQGLSSFNPEIINEDGDRFANNVEIVKKYKKIKNAKQVLLTNGEFIEAEIMSGEEPVLFIGTQNVPDKVREYITSSDIEVGVLVGNELVGTATIVRRQTGISTFVKFARSARAPTGLISKIEGLDVFRLPKVELSLSIDSITYNSATRQLHVTLKNNVDQASYFKGTYTIKSGEQEQVVGDLDPMFIDGQDLKTVVYDLDPIVGENDITADAFVIYGESKDALEKVLRETINVKKVEILDDTAIDITKVVYDLSKKKFHVYIKNVGQIDVYVNTEIIDALVLGERQTAGSENVIKISPGKTKTSVIKMDLDEEDIQSNPKVRVRAYFGQREDALFKIMEGDFDLVLKTFNIMTYLPIAVILILILLLLLAWRRRKKKEEHHH